MDFYAQETMHHLLFLKFVSCSFKVTRVSLNGSRRLNLNRRLSDNDIVTNASFLDVYARRQQYPASAKQDLIALNFLEFATNYKFSNGKLINQPDNIIQRLFSTYSSNPEGPKYGLYCKYQLIRHKPWSVSQDSVWGNKEESDETLIIEWKAFLQTPYAQFHVPDWHDKLREIEFHSEQSHSEDINQHQEREEWMI